MTEPVCLCGGCGEPFEPDFDVCWQCGAQRNGMPANAGFVRDDQPAPAANVPAARALDCLRCHAPMQAGKRLRLHEGSQMLPFLLDQFGELLVNRESFDTYACPACGKVEFFLAG
jgi:hypothetical protein